MDKHLVYGRVTVYATFSDGRVYWYGVVMGGVLMPLTICNGIESVGQYYSVGRDFQECTD